MLYIFHVDTGTTLTFDIKLALQRKPAVGFALLSNQFTLHGGVDRVTWKLPHNPWLPMHFAELSPESDKLQLATVRGACRRKKKTEKQLEVGEWKEKSSKFPQLLGLLLALPRAALIRVQDNLDLNHSIDDAEAVRLPRFIIEFIAHRDRLLNGSSSVAELKEAIERECGVVAAHQVLLMSGGESLEPNARVCSYSAGTDTSPIYLFSKAAIESHHPPTPNIDYGCEVYHLLGSMLSLVDRVIGKFPRKGKRMENNPQSWRPFLPNEVFSICFYT
ncbi:hypothetical protein K0M31_012676, partial [Melipona bicolor]